MECAIAGARKFAYCVPDLLFSFLIATPPLFQYHLLPQIIKNHQEPPEYPIPDITRDVWSCKNTAACLGKDGYRFFDRAISDP
jgi:hypothetical protein